MILNSAKRKSADQILKIIREKIINAFVELTQLINNNDIHWISKYKFHEHWKNYSILTKSYNVTHDIIIQIYLYLLNVLTQLNIVT